MIIEKWDILDQNGKRTGKTTLRGRAILKNGEYHLVVHIWIVSPSGALLIQKRSDSKNLMPGEWAATGGAAIAGEDSYTAAARELFEELGIRSTPETLKKMLRIKRRNSLLDLWLITSDLPVSSLRLQKSEVSGAKWVTEEQLRGMIRSGEFHNYGKEYFDQLFAKLREHRREQNA